MYTPSIRLVVCALVLGAGCFFDSARSQTRCQNLEEADTRAYDKQALFYEQSGTGTLAMMPNVKRLDQAKLEHEFLAFPSPGRYRVSRVSPWFVVNHRVTSAPQSSLTPTYLGVIVAKIVRQDYKHRLELYRDADGWEAEGVHREQYEELDGFFEIHARKDADLAAFQEVFPPAPSAPWHSRLEGDGGRSSWLSRTEWVPPEGGCLNELLKERGIAPERVFVQGYLLSFSPTQRSTSSYPVAWSTNLEVAEAMYVRTFSPLSSDFAREYFIEFSH